MTVFSKTFKGDEKAEWHTLDSVLITDNCGDQVLCQVCGETYDYAYFQLGCVVTCDDCGLTLEMVSFGADQFIVVYQKEAGDDLAKKFYDRLKA